MPERTAWELPNWFLAFLPRDLWEAYKTFFIYEQDFLPARGTVGLDVGTIALEADSHFLCVSGAATFASSDNSAIGPGQHYLVRIIDGASGTPINNDFVPASHMFGTAQRPVLWPTPKLFQAAGSIITELRNLAVFTDNVRLAYWGLRIYHRVPAARAEAGR